MPLSSAPAMTAEARGCSLLLSRLAAKRSSSHSVTPAAGSISLSFGVPAVIVPVLSRATTVTLPVSSRAAAVLNSTPCLAAAPLPTMMATGVASPRAQGQLMTSTDIPLAKAKPRLSPEASHETTVTAAIAITTGTKTPDTLSAALAMGAFVAAASLTMRIIWLRVVSSPTRVASQRI